MKHTINGVTVNFSCSHPELKHNTCPTGYGDCGSCKHCTATLSAPDFFELVSKQEVAKNGQN